MNQKTNTLPSYTECVRRVVHAAKSPIPFQDIVDAVARLRPITSLHPEQTVRNALAQARQIVHTDEGYWYLPYLLKDNVFRLPVTPEALHSGTMALTDEGFCALLPSFFENASFRDERPLHVQLDGGVLLKESIEQIQASVWGWKNSRVLYEWLKKQRAKHGDDLILTVVNAEERRYKMHVEHQLDRNTARIGERNHAVRAAALDLSSSKHRLAMWELVPRLVAHGLYRDACPPDPLLPILEMDLPMLRDEEEIPAPREQALDLLDQGIEWHAQGETREAAKCYRASLSVDPTFADGYNHLGNLAFERGNWDRAKKYYRLAFDLASQEFDPDEEKVGWWGMIETRPLMRALHGIGLCQWKRNKVSEAIAIFEQMMQMNPNDNQGARYLLGVLYHELGNRERAESWYRKTSDEPHVLFNWALSCWEMGQQVNAVQRILQGMVENPYVLPMLLGHDAPRYSFWHSSNLQYPETAADYIELYRYLWRRKGALKFLRAVWSHPRTRAYLARFVELRNKLTDERGSEQRKMLVDAEFSLKDASTAHPIAKIIVRDLARLGSARKPRARKIFT